MDENRVLRERNSLEDFAIGSKIQTPPTFKLPRLQNPKMQVTPESKQQFHEQLRTVTSSLSFLKETIGSALAESYKLSSCPEPQSGAPQAQADGEQAQVKPQELAVRMASKAKLLYRELKAAKVELASMRERMSQLEEENMRLYNSFDKNLPPPDEVLVKTVESMIAEKARLLKENAECKREIEILHEIINLHRMDHDRTPIQAAPGPMNSYEADEMCELQQLTQLQCLRTPGLACCTATDPEEEDEPALPEARTIPSC